jgi:hypothetical protein
MGLLCSTAWLIYGIYDSININIIIPNGLGVLFSVVQLICWIYFYKKAQQIQPELTSMILDEKTKA